MILGSPGAVLTPTPTKVAIPGNYITEFDFNNQNLPDFYNQEFRRYGDRTMSSFLAAFAAEYGSDSDLVKWAENGRLHTKYTDVTTATADAADTSVFTVGGGSCNFRKNQLVFLSDNNSSASGKAVISAVTTSTFTVEWYLASGQPVGFNAATAITAFVYGSEFKKGSPGMEGSLDSNSQFFENKMIIIKDNYEVAGSDKAQIGWVNAETEDGSKGYYWFLKSQSETATRFRDYMEMSMIESVKAENGSGAEAFLSTNTGGGNAGTEGMFQAVTERGNVWDGGYPTTMAEFDSLIDRLDKQGSISDNALFLNRAFGTSMDDMLAAQNSHGVGGVSYGLFNNSEEMSLNLGFDGFKRSGYEFYKTDWKYLNEATLRGGINGGKVYGTLVPAGSTSVYDQMMGTNVKLPFLHIKYRKSPHTDRRYKSWVTGGEAATSDIDKMRVDYLSERSLCTLGANNFFQFQA